MYTSDTPWKGSLKWFLSFLWELIEIQKKEQRQLKKTARKFESYQIVMAFWTLASTLDFDKFALCDELISDRGDFISGLTYSDYSKNLGIINYHSQK